MRAQPDWFGRLSGNVSVHACLGRRSSGKPWRCGSLCAPTAEPYPLRVPGGCAVREPNQLSRSAAGRQVPHLPWSPTRPTGSRRPAVVRKDCQPSASSASLIGDALTHPAGTSERSAKCSLRRAPCVESTGACFVRRRDASTHGTPWVYTGVLASESRRVVQRRLLP
jgi:hypothetical protein